MMDAISRTSRREVYPAFAIFYEIFCSPTKINNDPHYVIKVILQNQEEKRSGPRIKVLLLNFGENLGLKCLVVVVLTMKAVQLR